MPRHLQWNMNDLIHGFELIRSYIEEILILTKGDWTYHVQKLELTLNKMKEKGIKCNIEHYFFGKTKMKHLGFWVTRNGGKPINKNMEEITNMKPSILKKEVQKCIGGVNNYCNMLPRRSHTLATLIRMTSNRRKI